MFWDVGIKEYDLEYIEPINWYKSEYEKIIDREQEENTNKSNTTFSKVVRKKIMCGLCNFGCCNHKSFHVEITEQEQEKYRKKFGLDLELEWSQNGCCDLLSDDGSGFFR